MSERDGKRDFAEDFLRGCELAQDTQGRTALKGLIGFSAEKMQDLHESAHAGDRKSRTLLQNIEKGLRYKKEGEAGYGWKKDDGRFRMPEPPDGVFGDAVDYIHSEMIRNAGSEAMESVRNLEKSIWPWDKAKGLSRFRDLVREGGPWDHKNTLTRRQLNKGQDHGFTGLPSQWFYSPEEDARYFFDIFSNIHYGYIGAAMGYDEDLLLDAAGAVQKRTPEGERRAGAFVEDHGPPPDRHAAYLHYKIDWGSRGWDDPMDQAAIGLGLHMYRNYGTEMTDEDLRFEMRHWPGLNKKRKNP